MSISVMILPLTIRKVSSWSKYRALSSASVFNGENCLISPSASVSESVIWDDVKIESGARLNRTIIADGVTIKADEAFENAAIIRAEMLASCAEIPEKALKGFTRGENYVVPLVSSR